MMPKKNRVAKAQAISGTGANHLGGLFLAYQGFASGDLDNDFWAVRHLVNFKIPLLICQCFAKNAGPYGERIGRLTVVPKDQDEASRIKSQISVLQCSEISNPPANGARVVSDITNDIPTHHLRTPILR
ncbi:Aspartate aminotransferase, cytoplasmic [Puccinia graminis f. sp. tritici]|uniref:Aspartate aminotransferase, cytoplasmic n=1 Tax=Puccinia graminis f. sp. tritici TaxID=56615 RepID=A0A5B0QMZ2_PUCGR|nr:Aspartate aminotransferase, cytoplasmic [Puccinia graminis f. sp. tritici]